VNDDGVDLSVVIPAYNEADVIERCLEVVRAQLGAHLEKTRRSFEIVFVDDGSRDATPETLQRASEADPRVRVVLLSRNFGKESAMAAGLEAARGRAVLLMDADLQHPPDLIPRMVDLWDEGYEIVSAVKAERARESFVYRVMAAMFNLLMGGAAGRSFRGASDFKLLDRQVVDALAACPERSRFFRGLVTWIGFKTAEIPFTVAARAGGETKWSLGGLIRYSLKNLISFSAMPLKLVAAMGFGTLVFAAGLGVQTLYRYLAGQAVSGFTTVILLQLILGGLTLTSLGVIALYIAEIYDEAKRRPVFVVRRPRAAPITPLVASEARNPHE
jgi:dolichol-phosphate mannosyltransferase